MFSIFMDMKTMRINLYIPTQMKPVTSTIHISVLGLFRTSMNVYQIIHNRKVIYSYLYSYKCTQWSSICVQKSRPKDTGRIMNAVRKSQSVQEIDLVFLIHGFHDRYYFYRVIYGEKKTLFIIYPLLYLIIYN